jgi:hypothetical protein
MDNDKKDLSTKVKKDLVSLFTEHEGLDTFEEVFDADSDIMDDNINQGMKITRTGKPVLQTHLE